jgi:hypothetical protein
MTTLGERLTHLDREVLREALRRAGERDGVVEALAGTVGEANTLAAGFRATFSGPAPQTGSALGFSLLSFFPFVDSVL